jgi:epoxyqueuosine reductase
MRSPAPAVQDPTALADAIRDAALELGFARVGFCPVEPFESARGALESWLSAGHHGEMAFMAGQSRTDPCALLPRARSLVVVALAYDREAAASREFPALVPAASLAQGASRAHASRPLTARPRGAVARYARGADYHGVMKARLRRLADRCADLSGRVVMARPCVDTAPLLEREAARRAGIGFSAKNTMQIAPGLGSYFLLGELLLDVELTPSTPVNAGCGRCRSCLDACPTGAFVDAHTLDARRCISYLTIELKGPIPRELRPSIGSWVFGCDVCQEVCPFNHSTHPRAGDPELAARPDSSELDLVALLELGSAGHRRMQRQSALGRVSRARLQRNAAVALGNVRDPETVPALALALARNPSALVRGHAAWALGQIGGGPARAALLEARASELDDSALSEIELALAVLDGNPTTPLADL